MCLFYNAPPEILIHIYIVMESTSFVQFLQIIYRNQQLSFLKKKFIEFQDTNLNEISLLQQTTRP